MALDCINLEHLPASHAIRIALFQNIKNASFLHQQLLAGNTEFEYALIDASTVSFKSPFSPLACQTCVLYFQVSRPATLLYYHVTVSYIGAIQFISRIHALAAIYRAVNELLGNKLRSRNVHSEIVFSLSPNNNVGP